MFMGQYNETIRGGAMDLVFFKDAMVHIIKVDQHPAVPCFLVSFSERLLLAVKESLESVSWTTTGWVVTSLYSISSR